MMECSLCNQIKQPTKELNPCYPCDSCRNLICLECSKLTASEIRCLPLSCRVLKIQCIKCLNYEFIELLRDQINDKCQILKDKEDIIEILKSKITDLENRISESANHGASTSTYAHIAKNNTKNVKNNRPKIIIRPKMRQNRQKTKEDIEGEVKLQNLKIGVQKTTTVQPR
ncbi:unnamed protein product [Psylliodes chrysocephalus]|uniref:Uncharacterized protein n=1 Tax=Psylliodes chrysocephalus TaxID=3402493 RepID=A0A9P0D531_9CUCU|nr:unnamed protein product [Psylliodes chrysocephala]